MGLLSEGTPLSWPASAPYRNRVRQDGVQQFLSVYNAAKHFKQHELKWGDEVEYLLIRLDTTNRRATLSLRAPVLLPLLQKEEQERPNAVPVLWRPEYARWMIEGTPGVPYRSYAADLVNVERNMVLRRSQIGKLLQPGETVLSLTTFPRAGCGLFTTPPALPFGPVAKSFFTSDDVISPHPRFPTLTRNIRLRRGRKISIEVPLFIDENTPQKMPLIPDDPEHRALLQEARERVSKRDTIERRTLLQHLKQRVLKQENADIRLLDVALDTFVKDKIIMDSAAFGMGSSCLQVTIQGRDLSETRVLYDQLAVMAPIMLALTAATPALRGLLANTDVRWDVISAAMDDRTFEEEHSGSVPKSRYSSIDCYLSDRAKDRPESYNDIPIPINQDAYQKLREGGVDHLLAQHVAHLFIRDPLVIYEEKVEQDNATSTDHFENIQSTNWNTVRFKPPPPGTDIGWRTEFRSMEVGLTDFENAAFSVFIVLLSRVILAFNLNFYIPMSKVDENMETAHLRDAVKTQAFYFRKNIFKSSNGSGFLCDCGHVHNASLVGSHSGGYDIEHFCGATDENGGSESDCDPFDLLTLDEIFNGKPLCRNGRAEGTEFAGLIPLIRGYLDALKIDGMTRARLYLYLDFIADRASGALCTNASFIRKFIRQHPAYRGDSVVSQEINYDLMLTLKGISNGEIAAPELLGDYQAKCIFEDVQTAETMMALMQRKLEGPEAAMLHGASMPHSALEETLKMIAREAVLQREYTRCRC
ncbi:Glutamate--cysteine ligase [Gracilaria domingensis]|nr:Glutamate--cysteine ligase [Gracilaria domingensis]